MIIEHGNGAALVPAMDAWNGPIPPIISWLHENYHPLIPDKRTSSICLHVAKVGMDFPASDDDANHSLVVVAIALIFVGPGRVYEECLVKCDSIDLKSMSPLAWHS